MKNIASVFVLLFLSFQVIALEVWVWSVDEVKLHTNELENFIGPCGSISKIEISRFPDPDAWGETGMEKIVEYSEDKIVKQWSAPVDSYVIAVEEQSIYIPFNGGALKINSDGTFENVIAPEYQTHGAELCPAIVVSAFKESSYLRCIVYKDLVDQSERRIAYEGPCT